MRGHHSDEFSGMNSFIYGRSTQNQRIESFCAMLRRQCTNFWINLFKDMETIGLLNVHDPAHIDCLRLCFMDLIRADLQRHQVQWNTHYIYADKRRGRISGKPDKMYFLPEQFNSEDFGHPFEEEELCEVIVELESDQGDPIDVKPEFVRLANLLVPGWKIPRTVDCGLELFICITSRIANHDASV